MTQQQAMSGSTSADSSPGASGFSARLWAPRSPDAIPAPTGSNLISLLGLGALLILLMTFLWMGISQGWGGELAGLDLLRIVLTAGITLLLVGWLSHLQQERLARLSEVECRRYRESAAAYCNFFETIFEHTPAGLWVLDEDYRVLFSNAEGRRIHGHGVAIGERYPCDAAGLKGNYVCRTCPAKHTLEACEPARKKGYRTEPKTGEIVAVETFPIAMADGRNFALIVERSVTEQQRLQSSAVHREKMAAFGLLSAGIAHDLGNPLSGIELHLQLLQQESLPEEAAESVITVQREVARLRRTLRGLVDFARRRGTETSLVSIRSVVDDALRLLHYDQRMRGVEVSVEADPETPAVNVVEDHLMQVCLNLFLNSLDAMPEGGGLRLEVCSTPEGAALRVHDSGVGMSREVAAACCDAFFTTKGDSGGSGLGLSMARELIRAAGGEVEIHSAPGKGTTVIVSLPSADVELFEAVDAGASEQAVLPVPSQTGSACLAGRPIDPEQPAVVSDLPALGA